MTRLPGLTGREVIRALQKAGFVLVRTSGSHYRLVHPKDPSRVATVPVHSKKALKRGTLHGIIKQAGLTVEKFIALVVGGRGVDRLEAKYRALPRSSGRANEPAHSCGRGRRDASPYPKGACRPMSSRSRSISSYAGQAPDAAAVISSQKRP